MVCSDDEVFDTGACELSDSTSQIANHGIHDLPREQTAVHLTQAVDRLRAHDYERRIAEPLLDGTSRLLQELPKVDIDCIGADRLEVLHPLAEARHDRVADTGGELALVIDHRKARGCPREQRRHPDRRDGGEHPDRRNEAPLLGTFELFDQIGSHLETHGIDEKIGDAIPSLANGRLDQLRINAGLVEDATHRPTRGGERRCVALGHLLEERLVIPADKPERLRKRGLWLVVQFRHP